MVAHPKPEASKGRGQAPEVQDGYTPERFKYTWGRYQILPGQLPARRRGTGPVGHFLGFALRVLPRRCGSQGQKVSPFCIRRRYLRVSGLAIRPVHRYQNIYAPGQSGGSLSQDTRNQRIPVSRRLARCRRDLPASPQLPGHCPLGNAEGRVHAERRKV